MKRTVPLARALFLPMFLLAVGAILAVAAVSGLTVRATFSDYLAARQGEQLDAFVRIAASDIAEAGGLERFAADPRAMPRIFRRLNAEGRLGRSRQPVEGVSRQALPRRPQLGGPRPDGPGPEAFQSRVAVLDRQGRQVAGMPLHPEGKFIERELVIQGETVGIARLTLPPVPEGIDAQFLASQTRGLAIASLVLSLTTALVAWQVARRLARPLTDIQDITTRIAGGQFGVVLTEPGITELAHTARNLNAMSLALKNLESARRRWLAQISHELRTPLTFIRAELEAHLDGIRRPSIARSRALLAETLRLTSLVNDLHLLAMSDLGQLPCHLVDTDIVQGVRAAVARFQPEAAKRNLTLEFESSETASIVLPCDPSRLDQLLANALINSTRYTDAGGRIVLRIDDHPDGATLFIDDSTPGLGSAQLAEVFTPLFRADLSRSRQTGGSGLGLSICHGIAKAHGGRLTAQASPLGGLRLVFWLPRTGIKT